VAFAQITVQGFLCARKWTRLGVCWCGPLLLLLSLTDMDVLAEKLQPNLASCVVKISPVVTTHASLVAWVSAQWLRKGIVLRGTCANLWFLCNWTVSN